MNYPNESEPTAIRLSTFDVVNAFCLRAMLVALGLGFVEGYLFSRRMGISIAGVGLTFASLWFVAALFLVWFLSSLKTKFVKMSIYDKSIAVGLFILFLVASLFHRAIATSLGLLAHAVIFETLGAIWVAWVSLMLRFQNYVYSMIRYSCLSTVILMQFYASRWVDAHRAVAGAICESTCVPRIMLRSVFKRIA